MNTITSKTKVCCRIFFTNTLEELGGKASVSGWGRGRRRGTGEPYCLVS